MSTDNKEGSKAEDKELMLRQARTLTGLSLAMADKLMPNASEELKVATAATALISAAAFITKMATGGSDAPEIKTAFVETVNLVWDSSIIVPIADTNAPGGKGLN